MATTTNYSWTTPDDTALVKDGAAAIRSLGTAIDTTVFNNASAAIAKTIVDAKGDIIAATAADTVSRLAVGANDTVLTADSSTATGLKWATPASGGYTLISSGSLTGTSVSLTSIDQTYKSLILVCSDYYPSADDTLSIRVNSTSSIYAVSYSRDTSAVNDTKLPFFLQENMDAAQNDAQAVMFFDDYSNTTSFKTTRQSAFQRKADNTNYLIGWAGGFIRTTSAISSIQIEYLSGSTHQAGTYAVYGVK